MDLIIGLAMALGLGYGAGVLLEKHARMQVTQQLMTLAGIGYVAGWLASVVLGGGGLFRNIAAGVLGAFVGSFVLKATGLNLGIRNQLAAQVVTATIGAVIVTLLARLIA